MRARETTYSRARRYTRGTENDRIENASCLRVVRAVAIRHRASGAAEIVLGLGSTTALEGPPLNCIVFACPRQSDSSAEIECCPPQRESRFDVLCATSAIRERRFSIQNAGIEMHRALRYALLTSLLMLLRTHRTGAEETSLEHLNKGTDESSIVVLFSS